MVIVSDLGIRSDPVTQWVGTGALADNTALAESAIALLKKVGIK